MDDVLLMIPLAILHFEYRSGLNKDALFQNVGILPTLFEYAGIPGEIKMHGRPGIFILGGRGAKA
jgi:hypothetical protein